jgi:hypothetical protein
MVAAEAVLMAVAAAPPTVVEAAVLTVAVTKFSKKYFQKSPLLQKGGGLFFCESHMTLTLLGTPSLASTTLSLTSC